MLQSLLPPGGSRGCHHRGELRHAQILRETLAVKQRSGWCLVSHQNEEMFDLASACLSYLSISKLFDFHPVLAELLIQNLVKVARRYIFPTADRSKIPRCFLFGASGPVARSWTMSTSSFGKASQESLGTIRRRHRVRHIAAALAAGLRNDKMFGLP